MEQQFEINAKTFTLKGTSDESILLNDAEYTIPVYQRAYSWSSAQIEKLIQDIFISFWGHEKNLESEKMFIGTMQLMPKDCNYQIIDGQQMMPKDCNYQIIDGQQRLTTFLILFKVLELSYSVKNSFEGFKLSTQVSNGQQQEKMEKMLGLDEIPKEKDENNAYINNVRLINDAITAEIQESKDSSGHKFNADKFAEHILNNVYFVVIKTKASLSKTLKIFDAINTTGMDLNAGDIFKIRMYEYLKDIKKTGEADKDIFNKISNLYEKIDLYNKEYDRPFTSIQNILSIYQFYLIGKYELADILYTFATDTFFERLFDTAFKNHIWSNFKDKQIDLDLEVIDRLIESRYCWHKKWLGNELTVETRGMVHLWDWSRYSRLKILIPLFMYKFDNEKLAEFIKEIVKIHLIYSLSRAREVYSQKATFTSAVVKAILKGNVDECIEYLKKYNEEIEGYEVKYFKDILGSNIVSHRGGKVKNIICRLSALLGEENITTSTEKNPIDNIFKNPIDIEHIQSANDENKEDRRDVKKNWGETLNSIGNLVALERGINREIKNDTNKKLKEYPSSKLQIMSHINTLVRDNNNAWVWNKERADHRKGQEIEKITKFLMAVE